MSGRIEVLPKGTKVEGHVEPSHGLALALDAYERNGVWYGLSTNVVWRTGKPQGNGIELNNVLAGTANGGAGGSISVPAESIIGFTLTRTLTA